MFTAGDIKNVSFSKSMGGYKPEEVEIFLDNVQADYVQFEKIINDYKRKVESLGNEIQSFQLSQSSLQNVLISAQKLADEIVADANKKSEEIIHNAEANVTLITAKEKELATAFEIKANERKGQLEKELENMVAKAKLKADAITAAANDSVERQQVLFDKLKIEIAAFKSAITSKYKEHLNVLQEIPETVPMDPKKMAEVITAKVDEIPDVKKFISSDSPKSEVSSGFEVEETEVETEE